MRRPPFHRGSHPAPGSGIPLILLALLALPGALEAQGDAGCDVPAFGEMVMTTLANESKMLFFTTPTIRCPGGVRIRADSARVYEATNYNQLWGNVVFWDQDSRLSADQAQYFSEERRLVARGNAVLTDLTEGSVITGESMTLIRAGSDREEDFLSVGGGRPHATLYPTRQPEPEALPADTAGQETLPDTAGAILDTLGIPVDTTAAAPDTLGIPMDTVSAPGDTLQPAVADTTGAAPDTLGIPIDTVSAPGDTLQPAVADTTGAAVDTLEAPIPIAGREGDAPQVEPPPEPEPEAERVPYEIDAQRFVLEGSRYFRAAGSVIVTRDSLRAEADSLEYDQDNGALILSEEARVNTAKTDLTAKTIRLSIPQDEIREAFATGDAILEGEDLKLLAPIVTLFFNAGIMDRLVAVRDVVADSAFAEMNDAEREEERLFRGAPPLVAREMGFSEFPRHPYASAQNFLLQGDSLEVLTPGEVLQEVKAMGRGRGESSGADSLNAEDTPELIRKNWLEGDTIVALFQAPGDTLPDTEEAAPEDEPLPSVRRETIDADSTGEDYQLRQLLAKGGARSMYRMAASDSTIAAERGHFAIHYVVGDEIAILLNAAGEAERMEVLGQTRGIHLEPTGVPVTPRDSLAIDSLTVPDTLIVPDTLTVPDTLLIPDTLAVSGKPLASAGAGGLLSKGRGWR